MCTSTLPENGALAKRGPGKTGTQLSSNNAGTPAIFPDPPIGPVEKAAARPQVMRLAYNPGQWLGPVVPNTPAPPASIDAFAAEPLVFADLACLLATLHAVSPNAAMALACPASAL